MNLEVPCGVGGFHGASLRISLALADIESLQTLSTSIRRDADILSTSFLALLNAILLCFYVRAGVDRQQNNYQNENFDHM
jgi:hypothetical protein